MNPKRTHFYMLLDRSGSMAAIRGDVIGGVNRFLADQAADGPDARFTLVQFDGQDTHEVVADAVRVDKVRRLAEHTFVPRGSTPLLDATAQIIHRAQTRDHRRARQGKTAEAVIVVTVTDGHENASVEHDVKAIRRLVKEKEARGWTFVFLSADLAAYDDAYALGYDSRSVQRWAPTHEGAAAAFGSVSRAALTRRERLRKASAYETNDFFEGTKEAEG